MSQKCSKEGMTCDPTKKLCCRNYSCVSVDNSHICQKDSGGIQTGQPCNSSEECASFYCYKPSCDNMEKIGICREKCLQMGVCMLSNKISLPHDF